MTDNKAKPSQHAAHNRAAWPESSQQLWGVAVALVLLAALVLLVVDRSAAFPIRPVPAPAAIDLDRYVARHPDPDKWLLPSPGASHGAAPAQRR